MDDQQRQRQMDFLLEQQARQAQETAQLRRVLLSAIRLGRRERTDLRDKFSALLDAQIKTEDNLAAFQLEVRQFQAETRQAVGLLNRSLASTLDRVEALEDKPGNGGRPAN